MKKNLIIKILFITLLISGNMLQGMEEEMNANLKAITAEQIKDALVNGDDVNYQSELGVTALMITAVTGNIEACKLLLNNKADPNLQASNGWTALMMAISKGNIAICKLLLDHKANPDLQEIHGLTALALAVAQDNLAICELLIDYGARVGIKKDDITTLMFAAAKGNLKICQLLINGNAKKETQNETQQSWLSKSIYNWITRPLEALFITDSSLINQQTKDGKTALSIAAAKGHYNVCKFLIDSTFKLTKKQKDSIVALLGSLKQKSQPKDTNRLIAQRAAQAYVRENIAQNKNQLLAQINKITDQGMKQKLQKYIHEIEMKNQ